MESRMSYKVIFSLDLDSSLPMFFDVHWKDYTFRFKEVFGGRLTQISGHIPVGEHGHIKYEWIFKNEQEAQWWMRYGDYYVDVYWKKKRVATEIRLREPQEYNWYSMEPSYRLRNNHQSKIFSADKGEFDKLTKIKIALKLANTQAINDKKESHKVQQAIDAGKPGGSLIERAKASKRFLEIPRDYWILGERSALNKPNQFDDNIHLMYGEKVIKTIKGTTHPGTPSLNNPDKYNTAKTGSPIWDLGWHYKVWSKGRHKKKIDAFTQTGVAYIIRDTDKDSIPGNSGISNKETGKGLNFHPASYKPTGLSKTIGTWSTGCVVVQRATEY